MIDANTLNAIDKEICAGLPNEKAALDEARENQAFFDLDAERYIPMREAESTFDFERREKRTSGFLRECIEILTDDLYAPGPSRTFDVPAGHEFLERVWQDNLFDALMQRTDELTHLNRVVAVQVDACEGDFQAKPITLRLWGRDEFVVWTDEREHTKPLAVCTIDRVDLTTRYRLWTDTTVYEYRTAKAGGTSGGTTAKLVSAEDHDYGRIPFGFAWYDLPVRSFFPASLGTFLARGEKRIDDRLSRLDESIHKHLNPIPVAENVPDGWQPLIEPQRFIILRNRGPVMSENGYMPGEPARLSYLQSKIQVADAWLDLTNFANQQLEAARVPLSAVRAVQTSTASGFALICEQAPLLKRARRRRAPALYSECDITKAILECAGNHYGKAELVAAGKHGRLTLGWPEPTIPIPGRDRDTSNASQIAAGTKSKTMVVMESYSCDRPQAQEILKQIADDRKFEESLGLGQSEPTAAPIVDDKPTSQRGGLPDEEVQSDSDSEDLNEPTTDV